MFETWTYDSKGQVTFEIKIETSCKERRFPPKDGCISMVKLESDIAIEPNNLELLDNNQVKEIMYWSRQGFHILLLDKDEELPTSQEISEFLGKALRKDASEMNTYASEIHQLLKNVSKIGNAQFRSQSTNTPLLRKSGHSSGVSSGIWPPGIVLIMLAGFLTIIILPVFVVRRYNTGTRPVRNGEWLHSADPESTTN